MKKLLLAVLCLASALFLHAVEEVLIVADEFPAMQFVAARLKAEEKVVSRVVWQTNLPPDLSVFPAVVVYIHGGLKESAEKAFIAYTQTGGKLVVVHHSISSGKRKNREWFKFLGVSLPEGDVRTGGYQWTEDITQQIVNLAPGHFITTHKVKYPEQILFKSSSDPTERTLPGFTLNESEVYLNHALAGPHTLLLGLKYTDMASGITYMQAHSGWVRASGKGWIIYLQPGHSFPDLENPVFQRILLNAMIWKP